MVRIGLELRASGSQVRRCKRLATLSPWRYVFDRYRQRFRRDDNLSPILLKSNRNPYLSSLVFTSDWGRESAYGSIGVVVSGAITSTKPESQELECFQFLPILLLYSVTYDIAKTKLSEFEAEAEE